MFESMYAAQGIGLAAPQISISQRLTVIDVSFKNPDAMLVILTLSEVEWGRIPRISLLLLHVLAFAVALRIKRRASALRIAALDEGALAPGLLFTAATRRGCPIHRVFVVCDGWECINLPRQLLLLLLSVVCSPPPHQEPSFRPQLLTVSSSAAQRRHP